MNNIILGLIVVFLIFFLIIYRFNFKSSIFEKIKLYRNNILAIFLISISAFSIWTVTAKQEVEVLTDVQLKQLTNEFSTGNNDDILKNEIVVVGDSRMSLIEDDKDMVKPANLMFVAKSGMKIDWLENDALPEVNHILENKNFKYHIVVNMGVNDLDNEEYKGDEIAEEYFKLYSELAKENPDLDVYVLSVNPIDDELIKQKKNNHRTTKKIKLFNTTIQKELAKSNLDNMHYCDSYNSINFETYDGLHYTKDTNKRIINYINNNCVQY